MDPGLQGYRTANERGPFGNGHLARGLHLEVGRQVLCGNESTSTCQQNEDGQDADHGDDLLSIGRWALGIVFYTFHTAGIQAQVSAVDTSPHLRRQPFEPA